MRELLSHSLVQLFILVFSPFTGQEQVCVIHILLAKTDDRQCKGFLTSRQPKLPSIRNIPYQSILFDLPGHHTTTFAS